MKKVENRGIGELMELLLMVVLTLGEDHANVQNIITFVSNNLNRAVSTVVVHTTLKRLQKKGLITSWLSGKRPVRGGRCCRYYKVTTTGISTVHDLFYPKYLIYKRLLMS